MKLAHSDAVIPTFAEVLDTVNGKVPLIIEYKLDVPQTKVCRLANELLLSYSGAYCIESFHPLALQWYGNIAPTSYAGSLAWNTGTMNKYRANPFVWCLSFLLTNVATRPDFIAYRHSDASNFPSDLQSAWVHSPSHGRSKTRLSLRRQKSILISLFLTVLFRIKRIFKVLNNGFRWQTVPITFLEIPV